MKVFKKLGKTLWKNRGLIAASASIVSSLVGIEASADEVSDFGIDSDGNGSFDTDGDGFIDTVIKDSNTGGKEILMDTDGDGFIDLVGIDFDGDGKIDAVN